MLTDLIVKIDRKATDNIKDPKTNNMKGVAKAFGHGTLLGMFEGFMILGAVWTAWALFTVVKNLTPKK